MHTIFFFKSGIAAKWQILFLKNSFFKRFFPIALAFFLITLTTSAQPITSFPQSQSLRFGMDKIGNTVLFKGTADGYFNLPTGNILLRQNYVNTVLRTGSLVVRDNEDMFLRYSLPLDSSFTFLSQGIWQLVKNSPAFNLVNSERINSGAGIAYRPSHFFSSELLAGIERNVQSGFGNTGYFALGGAEVSQFDLEEYFFNARGQGEYARLTSDIENSDIISEASLRRTFDENNQVIFFFRYQSQGRDFIRPISGNLSEVRQDIVSIERHRSRRMSGTGDIRFALSDFFKNETSLRLDNRSTINYSRVTPVVRAASQVSFDEDQYELALSTTNFFSFKSFQHSLGFSLVQREEKNRATKRGDITADSLLILQRIEFRTDYVSTLSRLNAQSQWTPTDRDTARVMATVSLYRHDTPSMEENSDRDVFAATAGVLYARDVSPFFKAGISAQVQATHLVFLKAQLSGQNNWNSIIRLTPYFSIFTSSFSARPEFEIIANYTANDFESITGTSRSVSFRQLSYRDSVTIPFGEKYWLGSQINLRYFERGELRWNEFSEKPQSQRYEQFAKLLIFTKATQNITVGAGGRYYALVHKPYSAGAPGAFSEPAFTQSTAGVESSLTFFFPSGSVLTVNGWYEFQFINADLRIGVPNIFLNAFVPL
ncbi:MAG TPA: hypothetical protein VEC36_07710 [Patescibacteria group bacterium]|nr:hypothetical protein [Patescibacteria group bacterium]